jgi:hypothetical protein
VQSAHAEDREDVAGGIGEQGNIWALSTHDRLQEIRAQEIDELLFSHVIVEDEASELEVLSRILADGPGSSSS